MATALKETLREGDYVARWGGDEFTAVLYDVTPEKAREVGTAVCDAVRNMQILRKTEKTGEEELLPMGVTFAIHPLAKNDTIASIEADLSSQLLAIKKARPAKPGEEKKEEGAPQDKLTQSPVVQNLDAGQSVSGNVPGEQRLAAETGFQPGVLEDGARQQQGSERFERGARQSDGWPRKSRIGGPGDSGGPGQFS